MSSACQSYKKICSCDKSTPHSILVSYIKHKNFKRLLVFNLKKVLILFVKSFSLLVPEKVKIKILTYKGEVESINLFKGSQIVKCLKCEFQQIWPIPSEADLNMYYEKLYFDNKNVDRAAIKTSSDKKLRHDYQWELLNKYFSFEMQNKMLEFGAGPASMSYLLKEKYSDLIQFVVEPDKSFRKYHEVHLKSHCVQDISELNENNFSLIFSSHSFEHVLDPIELLKDFYIKLSKNGKLFIEVPNATKDFFNNYITDAPHISFFTISVLKKMVEDVGFKTLVIEEYGLPYSMYPPPIDYPEEEIEKPRKNGWSIRAVFEKIN